MKAAVGFALFAFAVGLYGQSAISTGASNLRIGSSDSEIAAVYGAPAGYFWRGSLYRDPPEGAPIVVAYNFTDAGDEFQLRVIYGLDNSQSNLHATPRAQSFILLSDHVVPILRAIQLLPGSVVLCRNGCSVVRVIPGQELLLTSGKIHPFQALTIQVLNNDADGNPISNSLKDMKSTATEFILSVFDFSSFPLTLPVRGGWKP